MNLIHEKLIQATNLYREKLTSHFHTFKRTVEAILCTYRLCATQHDATPSVANHIASGIA